MGWFDDFISAVSPPQLDFNDPKSIAQYMGRQQFGSGLQGIGQTIANSGRWWEPSGSQPQAPQFDPLRMLTQIATAQHLGLQNKTLEQAQKDQQAQRASFYGMYSPEQGGVPWKNPDTGQLATGGLLDKVPPEMRQLIASAGPEKGVAFLAELVKPKQPVIVPEGGTAIDQSGKALFTGPPKQTEAEREAANLYPNDPAKQRQYVETARMKPLVQQTTAFNQQQETEERKTVGKFYGEVYGDAQKAGFNAQATNAKLDALGQSLERTYSGTGGQTVLDLKKAAKALGMDVEGVPEGEVSRAIGRELALTLRNPSGGAGMPGALSNSDREFLESMVPGLSTTSEGNKLLLDFHKRINTRNIEVAKIMRDYRRQNGQVDEGLFDKLKEYSDKNPIFKPEDFQRAQSVSGATSKTIRKWKMKPDGSLVPE